MAAVPKHLKRRVGRYKRTIRVMRARAARCRRSKWIGEQLLAPQYERLARVYELHLEQARAEAAAARHPRRRSCPRVKHDRRR